MKKLFFLGFVFLFLLVSFVSGVGTAPSASDTVAEYRFEETTGTTADNTEGTSSRDGTINGTTLGVTGKIDNAFSFDGNNDYVSFSNTDFKSLNTHSVCMWIKKDGASTGGGTYPRIWMNGNINTGISIVQSDTTDDILYRLYISSTFEDITTTTSPLSDGNFHFYCFVYDGTNMIIYRNGSSLSTRAQTGTVDTATGTSGFIGGETTESYFNGDFDEILIFDTAITSDNVEYLYATGSPTSSQQYPFNFTSDNFTFREENSVTDFNVYLDNGTVWNNATGSTFTTEINDSRLLNFTIGKNTYFNITENNHNTSDDYNFSLERYPYLYVNSTWNNSVAVNNITVQVNSTNYTNTTGNRVFIPENSTLNVKVWSPNRVTNSTSLSLLSDNGFLVTMYQSNVSFMATEIITNNTLTGVTFTVDGNTDNPKFMDAGSYNVTASKAGYYSKTESFTITALTDETINVEDLSDTIINLSAEETYSSTTINNFTGWLYYNDTGTNISFSTTNGTYYIPARINETFYLLATSSGNYATATTTITPNSTVYNYTINLYRYNSILINFEDLLTGATVNNVTIDLISDVYSNRYTTTNGSVYPSILVPSSYNSRYWSSGYENASYYFSVSDDSYQNITLYLLNSSGAERVNVTVYDQGGQTISDAQVKSFRYDITSNTYKLHEIGTTNSEGLTNLAVTKNDEYYKFLVEYNGIWRRIVGTNNYYTTPSYITGNSLSIQVSLSILPGENFRNYLTIDYNLTFNENTDNFRLDYNDIDGISTGEMCVDVYTVSGITGLVSYNSTCSSSASGTILVGVANVTNTEYIGKATYTGVFLDSKSFKYPNTSLDKNQTIILQLLLTLTFIALTAFNPLLVPLSIPISFIIGRTIGFNEFSLSAIAIFVVVGIIISIIINKNRG